MRATTMDNSNAAAPLVLRNDHPADIMNKVASVAAFLELTVNGDHIKPDAPMTLHPDAMAGLAEVLGIIRTAAEQAADMA